MSFSVLSLWIYILYLTGNVWSAPTWPVGQVSSPAVANRLTVHNSSYPYANVNTIKSDPTICSVHNTGTVLVIRFRDYHPIDPVSMTLTLNAAREYVNRAISVRGDGWLPASNDPFHYDINAGIMVTARSAEDVHLTWKVLGNALQGLQECIIQNKWYDEAYFEVFNGDLGHVGNGDLLSWKKRITRLEDHS